MSNYFNPVLACWHAWRHSGGFGSGCHICNHEITGGSNRSQRNVRKARADWQEE